MDDRMASQGGGGHQLRDYRKGNWTVEETMILIDAKKMDDERRMKSERGKPIEQRWKWIEDYCWRKGCFRSQSQCNDKWDNLMRDFKKVREHERRLAAAAADQKGGNIESSSYWKMEKNQRKDKNLPSNMLSQIYEALVEVVERRGGGGGGGGSSSQRVMSVGGGGGSSSGGGGVERPALFVGQPPVLPPIMQHSTQNPTPLIPLPPPQTTLPQPTTSNLPFSQPLPTLDSDTSEHSDSPAKRRRRGGGGEGTSGGGGGNASGSSTSQEVVSAICKSATIMAEAIQAREDREERRHRELLNLHERRLQIEESKAESTRQGINGMVDAINKLADSILALASSNNNNQVTPR